MARFCANCGTEVDETAVFCPTCGQPIDQDVETAIPPAPAWPDATETASTRREPSPEEHPGRDVPGEATRPIGEERPAASPPERPTPPREADIRPTAERRYEMPAERDRGWDAAPPERPAAPPPPQRASERSSDAFADRGAEPPAAPARQRPPETAPERPAEEGQSPLANVPITTPVTMSGWLIGGGAAFAAVGALVSLFDGFGAAVDLLLFVALGAVALTVFFASSIPSFAHLRLATFAIVMVAFGAGLDRLLTGARGVGELLLFLGTAAAVIGAVILELGRDQPMGGPS